MNAGPPRRKRLDRLAPRVPPVAVFGVVALLMWAAAAWLPPPRIRLPGRTAVAILLLLAAGAVGIAGVRAFARARTTVDPLRPERAAALVTTGIYRRTRNPMYVALAIALLAWAVWLAQPLTLAGVVAFVAWMNRYQIAAEERALQALFGPEFDRYRSDVRRWL